jgi:hypothetical protein
LVLRKITGDPNVPAGRITVKADNGIPQVGGGRSSAKLPQKCRYGQMSTNLMVSLLGSLLLCGVKMKI